MDGNWFTDLLNMFFTFLDRIVYGLITFLYQLLLYLANLDLFGMSDLSSPDNVITNFSGRVYALLGIFMLFKVSFSILQYMVNPDDFSDKSKGFGKMVTNVLVSLCLIVAVPYIFQLAFEAQGIILKSNFLGHLILGETVSGTNIDEVDMSVNEEMAEDLQFLVYGSFFSVDTTVVGECANGPVLGTKSMAQSEDCLNTLAEVFKDVGGEQKLGDFFAAGGADSMARRFDAFGEVVNVKRNNKYVFKYMPVISTIAGGFVVLMLLTFCFDVAVRIVKLGFLEIIAPIPIISYMDPKQSGKDGMLGRWGSECFKAYISLFIRIAIIFFAFFVIDLVANQILVNPSDQIYLNEQAPTGLMAVFVQVMVILGVFMFAKEVPKLLERLIPGMQGAGDLNLNPFKNPAFSTVAGGAVGLGVGAIASGIAAGKTSLDSGESKFTAFRRGLGGTISGGLRGGISSIAAGGKNAFSKATSASGDVARNAALKANTKLPYRVGAYVRNAIGAQSLRESLDQKAGVFERMEKSADNMENRARDQLSKKYDQWKAVQGNRKWNEEQYAQGMITESQYTANLQKYWDDEQDMIREYIAKNGNMGVGALNEEDIDLLLEKENLSRNIKENGIDGMKDLEGAANASIRESISSWKDKDKAKKIDFDTLKTLKKASHNEAARIKNSNKYEDASNAEKAKLSDLRQSFLNKK